MNQTLTVDGIDLQAGNVITTNIPLQNPTWTGGTTGTTWTGGTTTWSSTQPVGITEEELIIFLRDKLKLKVEEFETNIMISIMLDEVEISSDYFMMPQIK